jgi:F-type H+-transporting ATPase subunit epsilon
VLHLEGPRLRITTRRYLRDEDCERVSRSLRDQLLAEERDLRATKESLRRMDEELLRRLWRLGQEAR